MTLKKSMLSILSILAFNNFIFGSDKKEIGTKAYDTKEDAIKHGVKFCDRKKEPCWKLFNKEGQIVIVPTNKYEYSNVNYSGPYQYAKIGKYVMRGSIEISGIPGSMIYENVGILPK
jgi:hypothetical protein